MLTAVLALSNAVQVSAAVVCIGSDGHVGVETLLEGCCISGAPGAQSDAAGTGLKSPNCGDCADVQLKVSFLRAKDHSLAQPVLCTASVVYRLAAFGCRLDSSEQASDTDQHWQSLKPISTVVLQT